MTAMQERQPVRERVAYHATLLGVMALVTTAALVIGNMKTKEDIKVRLAEDMQHSLQQVVPARFHDNNLLHDTVQIKTNAMGQPTPVLVYRARKAGRVTAVAYQMVGPGYGGRIDLIMGVDRNGKILGVRIISHHETPGLGDKIELKKSPWILSFNGRSLTNPSAAKWKVKKDGGIFDQFSGATITPRSVVKIIHNGLLLFAHHRAQLVGGAPATDTQHAK